MLYVSHRPAACEWRRRRHGGAAAVVHAYATDLSVHCDAQRIASSRDVALCGPSATRVLVLVWRSLWFVEAKRVFAMILFNRRSVIKPVPMGTEPNTY